MDISFEVDTWRPRKNDRYFPDDTFELILITISLEFVPKGPINRLALSESMMA